MYISSELIWKHDQVVYRLNQEGKQTSVDLGRGPTAWTIHPKSSELNWISESNGSRSLTLYRPGKKGMLLNGTEHWKLSAYTDICFVNDNLAVFVGVHQKRSNTALLCFDVNLGTIVKQVNIPSPAGLATYADQDLRSQIVVDANSLWLLTPKALLKLNLSKLINSTFSRDWITINKT